MNQKKNNQKGKQHINPSPKQVRNNNHGKHGLGRKVTQPHKGNQPKGPFKRHNFPKTHTPIRQCTAKRPNIQGKFSNKIDYTKPIPEGLRRQIKTIANQVMATNTRMLERQIEQAIEKHFHNWKEEANFRIRQNMIKIKKEIYRSLRDKDRHYIRNQRKQQRMHECALAVIQNVISELEEYIDMANLTEDREYDVLRDNVWLGDSGASTHMGNSDVGMINVREIRSQVVVGDGKPVMAKKIGDRLMTVHQKDGSTTDIVLRNYKYVPQLKVNLFSITQALTNEWNVRNNGIELEMYKGEESITFDHIIKTDTGVLCGVEMFPRVERDHAHPVLEQEGSTPPAKQKSTPIWNINRFHKVFNHCSEATLRRTAQANGWKLTGTLETCPECYEANIKQTPTHKETETQGVLYLVKEYLWILPLSTWKALQDLNSGLW